MGNIVKRMRSASRLAERAIEKAAAAAALRPAPVGAVQAPPLTFVDATAREAAVVHVELASLHAVGPSHGDGRVAYHHGPADDAAAATRAAAAAPKHHGPDLRVAAELLDADGAYRRVVLVGSLAAIRQALPDQATLDGWRAAGVVGVPVAGVDADGGLAYRYAHVDDVRRPLQMELASRGEAAEAARRVDLAGGAS